jgi:GNAT superfamily N-acetyltransferase
MEILLRDATEADLPRIIELIHLGRVEGRAGEDLGPPLPEPYYAALRSFAALPGARVIVAEVGGEVAGTLSFTVLPNLSNGGRPCAEVESVHVAEAYRSHGIGGVMMAWAIAEARKFGCFRLQLSSSKSRVDSHRFYERLGFVKSHEGMKLALD